LSSNRAEETAGAGRLLVDEPAPAVTRLTISNPDRRGALDHAILDAFASTLPELDARCIIITGEGSVFSAGYDLGTLPEEVPPDEVYPYPILAVLNGHAIGGGLELALACDLRLAAEPIKLGMPPAKLGLVYSHTGIRKFIEAIGAARTRELFLVGRRIDAATALGWGLVNGVANPDLIGEEALALAAEIAGNAPVAQRGNKRIIRELLRAELALDPETENELLELRRACFSTHDFREGVRAFAEKRRPHWQGR
jgi:enoyl-CoA hydratase/carnithine racemase